MAITLALPVQRQGALIVLKRTSRVAERALERADIAREQRVEIVAGRGLSVVALGGLQPLARFAIATAVVMRIAGQRCAMPEVSACNLERKREPGEPRSDRLRGRAFVIASRNTPRLLDQQLE